MKKLFVALLGLTGLWALGCSEVQPVRYHLSGMVSFQGQPVPRGRIFFVPNTAKGNSGVAGYAEIVDGIYDTADHGEGGPGGEVTVRIEGYQHGSDNKVGRPLFLNYQTDITQPQSTAVMDFAVPTSAALTYYDDQQPPP